MGRVACFHGWVVVGLAALALTCCSNVAAIGQGGASPTEAQASDLVYLFHRPAEPVFSLRGVYRNVAFDVPASYLPERYKRVAQEIRADVLRSGARLIGVPDLPMPTGQFADVNGILAYRSPYTISAPPFLALSVRFWHFFRESRTVPELLARAVWARLHFNPEMVLTALIFTMLRSSLKEIKDVQIPELPLYLPDLFTDDEFFAKAREQMYFLTEKNRIPVPVERNVTADAESALWYFREDLSYHVMHWKWHFVYPAGSDDPQYIDLPRRGELFVHFHRNILARYNAERFTNGLPAVTPMDVSKPLANGYFPKMVHLHGGRGTIGRQADTPLTTMPDFIRNHFSQRALYDTVLEQEYVVYKNGTKVKLEGIEGLDIVSNLLEGNSLLSPNIDVYGNIHNDMHGSLSIAADPAGAYKEPFSVTSYITTVARDPNFYNLHMLMDDLYSKYKRKLRPYSRDDVTPLPRVLLHAVAVRTVGARRLNALRTFIQETDVDVSLGLDYTPHGRQYARFPHLQHRRFDYILKLVNSEKTERKVFIRIFLLMTENEKGEKLDVDFQRRFAIQMDTFETTLLPGANTVQRASSASALSIDHDAIFSAQSTSSGVRRVNSCRCGWPQGLLLPRGSPSGTPYKILAMVTDYEQDGAPASDSEVCRDGWLLCGVPGSSDYPDRRAMGFPLDRPYRSGVRTLRDFLTPNMAVADVVIAFEDRTERPGPLLRGGISTSWMPT